MTNRDEKHTAISLVIGLGVASILGIVILTDSTWNNASVALAFLLVLQVATSILEAIADAVQG